ncbi:MAG: hypothetical protein ACRD0L_10335 [Acidimicrobiales bacterium]
MLVSPGAVRLARRRLPRTLGRHWLFVALFAAAVGLRAVVTVAYWPGLELFDDSYLYLANSQPLRPAIWHPAGYSIFLRALSPVGHLGVVPVVQHLLGLGLAVLAYVFLLRLGVRRPLAALGALPLLLDGYQLDIEQFVLAETLVDALLLGGLTVLLWRPRTTTWRAAAAALLLAAATLTRTAALPVLLVVGLYLLLKGRWRPLLAYTAVAVAALVGYGGWYAAANGYFGYSDYSGYFLYGRVAPLATCDYPLPGREASLCPKRPVSQRSQSQEYYDYEPGSPLYQPGLGTHQQRNSLAKRFAEQVILHQPLAYAAAAAGDTWHYFTAGRWMDADRISIERSRFPSPDIGREHDRLHVAFANAGFGGRPVTADVQPSLMDPLRRYQSIFYTQGPMLLAALLGAAAAGARLCRRNPSRGRERWCALVLAASGLVLAVGPSLTAGFSYRYEIPLLALLPLAGVIAADLGVDALLRRRRQSSALALELARPDGRSPRPVGTNGPP